MSPIKPKKSNANSTAEVSSGDFLSEIESSEERKEAMTPGNEYDLLRESIQSLTTEVKEFRVSQDLFRREIASGFVSRDVMDLRMDAVRASIAEVAREVKDVEDDLNKRDERAISHVERMWLRIGTLIGATGAVVAVIELLMSKGHP